MTELNSTAALYSALAAFQAEMPIVTKGKTARIPGKNGGAGYSYSYADLADVSEAARPVLAKHGLAFVCLPGMAEGGGYELQGTLVHRDGGSLVGSLPIAGRQAQEIGSSLTYLRRYLFGCLTGIVTDDDDDGARAHRAQEQTRADRGPAAAGVWAEAQHATDIAAVKVIWHRAESAGLLDEYVVRDGQHVTLAAALEAYGDALITTPA